MRLLIGYVNTVESKDQNNGRHKIKENIKREWYQGFRIKWKHMKITSIDYDTMEEALEMAIYAKENSGGNDNYFQIVDAYYEPFKVVYDSEEMEEKKEKK